MNKAFLREPDDNGQRHCPRCGSLGVPVTEAVLSRHLLAEARRELGANGFFCPFPRCEVVYFDLFERVVLVAGLASPVWPKDPDAPICACFGLTADDIEADLTDGRPTRVRALLEKSKGPQAQCSIAAASGQCCVAEVQRYYMRRLQERRSQ